MRRFLLRRIATSIVTLFGISIVVFTLSHLGPDPLLMFVRQASYGVSPQAIQELRAKWGLDKPAVEQYLVWVGHMLRGDLGRSIGSQERVTTLISQKIGATLQLGLAAFIVAAGVGIPLGVISAIRRGGPWDYLARFIALIGQATPSFWLGIVAIFMFAVKLHLLPVSGRATGAPIPTQMSHFVMPALVLAFGPWAIYLRLTRSAMLEILDSEYIKLARSKGVGTTAVIWKHAFRNALIQPLTVSALVLASFITGTVFVEQVFAWPGIGRMAVTATYNNDFPIIQGVVLLFGGAYVFMNLVADISYAYIDPRIRY